MYQNNPEEFIAKVIRLVKEQKATMIVEHITYDTIEGSYDSSIFTAEKHGLTMDKAYPAKKAIQDYVFTGGSAEKSVERNLPKTLMAQTKCSSMQSCPEVSLFLRLLGTIPRTGRLCSTRQGEAHLFYCRNQRNDGKPELAPNREVQDRLRQEALRKIVRWSCDIRPCGQLSRADE